MQMEISIAKPACRGKSNIVSNQTKRVGSTMPSGKLKTIKSFRRKPKSQHLAIDALHDQDENTRAELFPTYFKMIQWALRPVTAFPTPSSNLQSVYVNCNNISVEEFSAISSTMKYNRQYDDHSVPAEYLQVN